MNERIPELVEQATRIEESDELFPREVFDKEKFAELIVRECLTVISEKTDRTHIYTTFDRSLVEGTIERSMKAVKKHFGV